MSRTPIDVQRALSGVVDPCIVIVGAWHDALPSIPHPSGGVVQEYLPDDPRYNIWCIEPMPHCVDGLRAKAQGNPRLHVVPFAVSDFEGIAKFHQHPAVDQTNSLRRHTGPLAGPREGPITTGEVYVQTLDGLMESGLLPDGADYVTLDVQGGAGEAIRGGQRFLRRSWMVWAEVEFVELYEGQALYPEVRSAMEELGFEQVTEFDPSEIADTQWADAMFVNREIG